MIGKYWTNPAYTETLQGIDSPAISDQERTRLFKKQPHISISEVPVNEWFWFDADEQVLSINVHQTYFDIANAGRKGGELFWPRTRAQAPNLNDQQMSLDFNQFDFESSLFTPRTKLAQPEWSSLVLEWADVLSYLGGEDENYFPQVEAVAREALHELDSIVHAVSFFRFEVPSKTPQLIDNFYGSLAQAGALSWPAKQYIKRAALDKRSDDDSQYKDYYYEPASSVLAKIDCKLLGKRNHFSCGFGVGMDGRFVSNTGVCMGTGSLEVLPDEIREYKGDPPRGYHYSSHNLDTATWRLWAFAGLARLIGDAHRHYVSQANF